MKVILLKDIKKVGKAGDVLEFNDGYANNFLFPNKLATEASKLNIDKVEHDKKIKAEKLNYENTKLDNFIISLNGREFEFCENATSEGNLYKHLSIKSISEKLSKELGKEITKLLIFDFDEIKKLGSYSLLIDNNRTKSRIIISVVAKTK